MRTTLVLAAIAAAALTAAAIAPVNAEDLIVSGVVTYPSTVVLPAGAQIKVEIFDDSIEDIDYPVLSKVEFTPMGSPTPFEMHVDSDTLNPEAHYRIMSSMAAEGTLVMVDWYGQDFVPGASSGLKFELTQ